MTTNQFDNSDCGEVGRTLITVQYTLGLLEPETHVSPHASKCQALNCQNSVYKDGYCYNCYHDVHGAVIGGVR